MRLSVGSNWDLKLIEDLAGVPEVVDLCGMLRKTVVGCGSAAYLMPQVSDAHVETFIRDVHKAGRTFTLIVDAPNMEATEWEPEVHKRVLAFFGHLEDLKVDFVELAIPYLVELVHRRFPKLRIKVSPTTRTATIDTVGFLEEMGAAAVGLEPMIQRRFNVMKVMARDSHLPLFVEPTCGILRGSPSYGNFDLAWTNSLMSSERFTPDAYSEFSKTYNHAYDDGYKIEHPVELVRINFIRPEDLARYEEIGINDFKLDVGLYTTPDIVRRVGAYVGRKFDGNLTELANLFYFGHVYQSEQPGPVVPPSLPEPVPPEVRAFFDLLYDKQAIEKMVSVDNRTLDGYLDHVSDGQCDPVRCATCEQFAAAAVRIDGGKAAHFVSVLKAYRHILVAGTYLP